ncbi:MAG: cyclic nucleotide-binding domain-containing protein [Hormoscilla sp. GM7CHS1pb]|nr:cyclic nucleotide-binding domain-containing protein [Hormoscilla sp. GM7CHS1pb]
MLKDNSALMSDANRLQFLRKVPIFTRITSEAFLEQLATNLDEVIFTSGQTIFTQGEEGHLLYILVEGKIKIHIEDFPLAQLEPVAYFGEMALLDSQPRSASAIAVSESKCLVLTSEQVYQAIESSPSVSLNIIRLLCQRVRKLNRMFGASEDIFYDLVKRQVL